MKSSVEKKNIPVWVSILIFIAVMTVIMVFGMMI
jgi:purine-cytosine permease-like protein